MSRHDIPETPTVYSAPYVIRRHRAWGDWALWVWVPWLARAGREKRYHLVTVRSDWDACMRDVEEMEHARRDLPNA